jgi:hypothetical protein
MSDNTTQQRNALILKTGVSLLESSKEGLGLSFAGAASTIFDLFASNSRQITAYEQCLMEKRDVGLCAHLLKKE